MLNARRWKRAIAGNRTVDQRSRGSDADRCDVIGAEAAVLPPPCPHSSALRLAVVGAVGRGGGGSLGTVVGVASRAEVTIRQTLAAILAESSFARVAHASASPANIACTR